jgi:hypothetical protein
MDNLARGDTVDAKIGGVAHHVLTGYGMVAAHFDANCHRGVLSKGLTVNEFANEFA